jgi:hypothetical protein
MMTSEQKLEAKKAVQIAMLSKTRTGYSPEMLKERSTSMPVPGLEGLQLSELMYKPMDWFHPNPANKEFDALKTPEYWDGLKRDIKEVRCILNPLIALPDGTLIEGHSRWKLAGELLDEGIDLGKLPVLIIASPISQEEIEKRVYLGNLSRFEIDEDLRPSLYVKIWPDFFLASPSQGGRPKKSHLGNPATGAEFSRTAQEIKTVTGKRGRQIRIDRAISRSAAALAKQEGYDRPEAAHIKMAREVENEKRRKAAITYSMLDTALEEIKDLLKDATDASAGGGLEASIHAARAKAMEEVVLILRRSFKLE